MPLSRNLYETYDLAASLLLSLEERNIPLALTITNELQLSLETELVHNILGFAWLLAQPDKDLSPQRFTAWRSRRYDILLSTFTSYRLALPPLTLIGDYPPPSTGNHTCRKEWYAKPAGWTDNQCGTLYHRIQHAIENKQCWRAYLLARPLLNHPTAFQSFLQAMGTSPDLLKFAQYQHLHGQILEHSMYILAYPPTAMEISIQEPVQQGRLFTIQPTARNRWNIQPTPPIKIIGQMNFIFEDSPYWNQQCDQYQINLGTTGHIQYESEQLYQDFFQHNFPLDIPDEWSQAERDKSHPAAINYQPEPNPWASTFHQLITPIPVTVSR
uniref:Uncharacterized protein n=1 Tax=viral metagenome TaxID=1070528 RepID=A0A6C0LL24_9ZZZZ